MADILALITPFFGLIFIGFLAGKIVRLPESALGWLNIFIIYVALPALFFQLLSETPLEQLTNWSFVLTTTFATFTAFAIAFAIGVIRSRGHIPEATIQGIAGAYSNIGYMGPGLTLATFGPAATVPTALIFCFDNTLLFTLAPLMMAVGGTGEARFTQTALLVLKRVFLHPFILATIAGVLAAAAEWSPPTAIDAMLTFLRQAAAPCALFAMGVTVALRPLGRVPSELPVLLLIKLIIHPIMVWVFLSYMGNFDPVWVFSAILMAALPPALNVFIMARQYGVYVERASSTILIGTIVSVPTVTVLLVLMTTGVLPADLFP